MSSNYSIVVDTGERHEDYVRHIFRALLSETNSTFNSFIERTKDYWDTVTEDPARELIHNATDNYNNMVSTTSCTKTNP